VEGFRVIYFDDLLDSLLGRRALLVANQQDRRGLVLV